MSWHLGLNSFETRDDVREPVREPIISSYFVLTFKGSE
jgi:hypothetical protein